MSQSIIDKWEIAQLVAVIITGAVAILMWWPWWTWCPAVLLAAFGVVGCRGLVNWLRQWMRRRQYVGCTLEVIDAKGRVQKRCITEYNPHTDAMTVDIPFDPLFDSPTDGHFI